MVEVFKRDYGYVATKDFESFYRSVVLSALEYRDFLATLPNAYGGVRVHLQSTGVRGSGEDLATRSDRWEVEFRDMDVDGIHTFYEYDYVDLYELEDFETEDIVFSSHSRSEVERVYNSYVRDRGLTGKDALAFKDTFNECVSDFVDEPKYITYCSLYDVYEDMVANVDAEFVGIIVT